MNPPEFRTGYVAIVGSPNVGKSTLLNAVLGQKISIVSSKPQTTRHRILGISTGVDHQIIFLDTPGLLEPKYLLHHAMRRAAESAAAEADLLLFLVDARMRAGETKESDDAMRTVLSRNRKRAFLAINKIDLVDKHTILPVIEHYAREHLFAEIFPISALTLDGVDDLIAHIVRALPEHPPFYPADVLSVQSERFFVAEIIREKIFEQFRDEIPYSTTVDIIDFREQEGRKNLIHAEIYVERDSQKGILIGKGGNALKSVGKRARTAIEEFLGRPVFLDLHVKVREGWRGKPEWLKRLGYDQPE